ncbi:hypothetical protein [Senegalia massiliensis]|uniref:Uncharacterized protein n=1 Tax=Senegalia massiliensis TaxID=1720316 RepID=A0A845QXQ9_9CLOT|nr:hypothetical protein [Senegalia massiliensis]NBI06579.1 hypothetical protein [Senegalia massiliensis]
MVIIENINSLKNSIQDSIFLKLIIMISALIYPTIFVLGFNGILNMEILNPMLLMWIGFYTSIILIYFVGISLINILIVLINVFIILFLMFVSMMGGSGVPWALIIKMILPIIPFSWIISLF